MPTNHMLNNTPAPDDLRIFARVARLGSFTKAAQQLGVPRPTVSTAVLRLEAQLGARLLQRTTRRVQLTSEGERVLVRCETVLDELDELGALFQPGAQLSGRLRVDMPLGMATGLLMARLPEFLALHPALRVEICSTDRRVDVVGDGFDCVIRAGQVVDESLAVRPLGMLEIANVASTGYIAQHGMPADVAALSAHWLVHYHPNPADGSAQFDYVDPQSGATVFVPMAALVTVNNSAACEAACRAGLGIAQIARSSAERGIAEGVLVEVLPDHRSASMPINLLYPHRRHLPRRVRVFADWVLGLVGTATTAAPWRNTVSGLDQKAGRD